LEILQITRPPLRGDPAHGLRAVVIVALGDRDQRGFLEHLQVPAEIAVGERAHLLEVAERQALGMGNERGEYGEARTFMDQGVEAVIGETAALLSLGARLRHRSLRCTDRGLRPSGTARARTECP